jgi:DNA-directed RNA polymerase subunit RPC12/RpoP
MGFRFRKSIKIIPGVRLNLSKTGLGASVGFKGFRLTKRADGRVQRTTSIPGTGISYVESHAAGGSFDNDAQAPSATPTEHKTAACPNCGHRYTIGKVNFCAQCGAALRETAPN